MEYIYFDESGSVNNHSPKNKYFVIAMIHVNEENKAKLKRSYKRFVKKNIERLKYLDKDKVDFTTGLILRDGHKMFDNDKFLELKGSQFDREMKCKFVEFLIQKPCFEIYYIRLENKYLTDSMCSNSARAFNYPIKLALEYFIKRGYLPKARYSLQLDERNEAPESRYFLKMYLNTELLLNRTLNNEMNVDYFDSSNNFGVQIADVFSNLYYSELMTGKYKKELQQLKDAGVLKPIFIFPLTHNK